MRLRRGARVEAAPSFGLNLPALNAGMWGSYAEVPASVELVAVASEAGGAVGRAARSRLLCPGRV